ncbi:MAG: hypothetical protein IJ736_04425 [Firmicutes bacterium]|nr:hypothetical protein [Bacillota bacterium]
MSSFNFGIIPSDKRYTYLTDMLISDGHTVSVFNNDLDAFLSSSDIIIAPIPFSRDSTHVFTGNETSELPIGTFLEKCHKNNIKAIISTAFSPETKQKAASENIPLRDFFEEDYVAVLNAIPTAEGAICSAIQESEGTLFSGQSLVIGFGRCGKVLANMLKGIGSSVSVTYRKEIDNACITSYGHTPIKFSSLIDYIGNFDYIFNTAPSMILSSDILAKVKKGCTIIDIAQAPGGVDYSFAANNNIKAVYCPALPGRVAPVYAAQVLKKAVLDITNKLYCNTSEKTT